MPDTTALYDEDFVAWTRQQAEALRAARARSNEPIDWENLAEEIEDLGNSLRRELASRVRGIIEHLLKLEHSPAPEPRAGWRDSIRNHRDEVEDLLQGNPTLRRELGAIIRDQTKRGARRAVSSLEDHEELTAAERRHLRSKSYLDQLSFSEDQILGDWFPPEPANPGRGKEAC